MTDLILRIFVRDHKNTEDPAVRDKCGRVAGAVGIVTNFLLFLILTYWKSKSNKKS